MITALPDSALEALDWSADQFTPFLDNLVNRELDADSVDDWLADWTAVGRLISEVFSRIQVATSQNTADEAAEARYKNLMETIYPEVARYENQLNEKLLASGLTPDGMDMPLRKMRADAELFREANLPLVAEESALKITFDKITGSQTVDWEGETITLQRLGHVLGDSDRARRERAWRLLNARKLEDRAALNDLWRQFMDVRKQIAANADTADYGAYMWIQRKRFDYTPSDAQTFADAIEAVAVPAATRIYERRRDQLGVDSLRPWDVGGGPEYHSPKVDPLGRDPLKPYDDFVEFETTLETIFTRVDPALGAYFKTMRAESLLDIENRNNKRSGAYCTRYSLVERPFVFGNATGSDDDVRMMLHECGHAFHGFESFALPYIQQQYYPIEFAEVASMAMELLAAPYLRRDEGGFYDDADAARSRINHLEKIITFWPFMAVIDSFQRWVYANHETATDPAACDAQWGDLWDRFLPGIDYSGLDEARVTGWHRKMHIFRIPFYYIEYGLAQLGAVQVWANARTDQAQAVRDYRRALALGGSKPLPELFATAGARFAFDEATLRDATTLVESELDRLWAT